MDYFTWEDAATVVKGERRLQDMLLPSKETADLHPEFNAKRAIAQRRADLELQEAGYTVPLTAVTDPLFQNAVIGLFVGYATESSSSREPWQQALFDSALSYFEQLKAGTITVLGAEVDSSSDAAPLILASNREGTAVFDTDYADAETLGVFASLGRGPYVGGWRH